MKNAIDGVPASYDSNYVLKTEKKCPLCKSTISQQDITNNNLICTENFDFIHKACLLANNYETLFTKPNDPTSMARVVKTKTDDL